MNLDEPKTWSGTPADMREELAARSGLAVECEMVKIAGVDCVAVRFEIIPEEPGARSWLKPFTLEPHVAVPDMFLEMLAAWRKQMQMRLDQGAQKNRGTLLGAVVAEHGIARVRMAVHTNAGASGYQ